MNQTAGTPVNVRPLTNHVILEHEKLADKVGSIFRPDPKKDLGKGEAVFARVVAVGSGKVWPSGAITPTTVKVGDRVIVGYWEGTDIEIDGRKLKVVFEEALHAVVEDAEHEHRWEITDTRENSDRIRTYERCSLCGAESSTCTAKRLDDEGREAWGPVGVTTRRMFDDDQAAE